VNIRTTARRAAPQRGMTLIVVLILLTALGLMAALGVRSGTTNLLAVGNTQSRQEAMSAAQAAIERTISTKEFSEKPAVVAALPIAVDVDGDGKADETVTLNPAPSCYNFRVVKMSELDGDVPADVVCMRGNAGMNAGIDAGGIPVGDSMCADSEWNVRATVNSPANGAQAVVNQGVAMRGVVTDAANNCP
jgi:type II secretory pathway pseudopilin PulG